MKFKPCLAKLLLSSLILRQIKVMLANLIAVSILSSSLIVTAIPAATAASCYTLQNHSVCLISIQRSAKNYWEYRVKLSINGVVQPVEVYNCRDRLRVSKHNTISFAADGIGEKVCSLFKRS
jgi:hypothetical protein